MELQFNLELVENYKSNSQKARILTEDWVYRQSYCPNCGNNPLNHFENNRPVADFFCNHCSEEFELKSQTMSVFDVNLTAYTHPFLSFRISVSEGSYVRSYAQILAEKLGVKTTLSALKRVSEGKFVYENERFLNPLDFISLPRNEYLGDPADVMLGKKLSVEKLKFGAQGLYLINFDDFFSIIEIKDETVTYKLNKVGKC